MDVAGARDLENHGGVPSHAGHTGHSPCRINPEVGRVSSVTFRLEFPNFYIVNFGKLLQQLPYNTGVYSCLHLILGLGTPPRESINVQLEELYALVTPWQCCVIFVKLRQGSGKEGQGMALRGRWKLEEVCRVTMGHLRVTLGHLRVTTGHLRVTKGHLKVIMGHLRLAIGYL